jgi:hypothetical protein
MVAVLICAKQGLEASAKSKMAAEKIVRRRGETFIATQLGSDSAIRDNKTSTLSRRTIIILLRKFEENPNAKGLSRYGAFELPVL